MSNGQPDQGHPRPLSGRRVFLSASIPGKDWTGEYDPLEITDAVIACVSALWTAGGRILCGGHPAITPLLLRVAHDFRSVAETNHASGEDPLVTIYQSTLYEGMIPQQTLSLQATGLGRITFVPAVPGDTPDHGRNAASLDRMRQAMLARENDPAFAIFIGGMEGITAEFNDYQTLYQGRPVYPVGAPGGEARRLAAERVQAEPYLLVTRTALLHSAEYGALMDDILADAITRIA